MGIVETGGKGGHCRDREERWALYRQGRKGGHCTDREEKVDSEETYLSRIGKQ